MQTLIEVNKKDINGVLVFEFNGELDETNADKTFKTIYDEIGDFTKKSIILNMSGLKYINSKSIGYIADVFSNIEDSDGKMYICNCSEGVKDILELVGITTIIPTVDTEEEALKEIK
ncbi:MAG: STAS domain-containing protein [Candidatus Gracilibacteria bacterium]|nr:STAS domain-containing protein [Candidatus Gracilibacteria bacterium]